MSHPDLPRLPERQVDSHKGIYGDVLVIAGSAGMTGAGALCSKAVLRSGAGLVTWAIAKSLNTLAESMSMEVMTLPVPETPGQAPSVDAREHLTEAGRSARACVIGPGLPVAGETGELMRLLIPEIHAPLVIDAGALTAIGDDWKIIRKRKNGTIITPHPGEMARLVKKTTDEVVERREQLAKKYAQVSGAIVALKGAGTLVTDGKEDYVNSTGNPGMSTAGTGDVLAGIIAGLLSQGMEPYDAARVGVYLHGLAGDLAAEEVGEHSLIAGDILTALPKAIRAYQE